jgi:hypothetical protein
MRPVTGLPFALQMKHQNKHFAQHRARKNASNLKTKKEQN